MGDPITDFLDQLILHHSSLEASHRGLAEAAQTLRRSVAGGPIEQPLEINSIMDLIELVKSDKWPEAASPLIIVNTESEADKVERSIGIIDVIVSPSLAEQKFLDFGCGEGYCVRVAADEIHRATLAVGYDIQEFPQWKGRSQPNEIFTTSLDLVRERGPYDHILLFDVIDHLTKQTPIDVLRACASLLTPTGKIYLRCHPFCSRHATHLYHSYNKAFLHLVLTEDELKHLEISSHEPNLGVCYPQSYEKFIAEAGLQIKSRLDTKEPVEQIFRSPAIASRIQAKFGTNSFPELELSIQFIDFLLQK